MALETFYVEIQRTIVHEVELEAQDAETARRIVEDVDYPLPAHNEWEALKGEEIIVRNVLGDEVSD